MKLALGTAQFGLDYGVTNKSGQVAPDQIADILRVAHEYGIDTIDTAIGYGDSEARLGQAGVGGWKVVTKLPGLPAACPDVGAWVEESVDACIARLGVEKLYGLLLHHPADLLGPRGSELFVSLQRLKDASKIEKIGISIYSPVELDAVVPKYALQMVQAPYNVFDRRLETSGWMKRLAARGIKVHTRSTFLQGLLLLQPGELPAKFAPWTALWEKWHSWLENTGLTPIQAALGFACTNPDVDRVLVGVDSTAQLQDIVSAAQLEPSSVPDGISSDDEALLDPSRWNKL